MLGRIEGESIKGQEKVRWLDGITDSVDMNLSKLRENVEGRGARRATVHGVAKRHNLESEQNNQSLDIWATPPSFCSSCQVQ